MTDSPRARRVPLGDRTDSEEEGSSDGDDGSSESESGSDQGSTGRGSRVFLTPEHLLTSVQFYW
jgi:hypothetical protein